MIVAPEEVAARRSGARPPAVLDTRDEAAFAAGHLEGAGNVPEPELEIRRAELPPRDHPVLVVAADRGGAEAAAARLHDMGYADVDHVAANAERIPGGLASTAPPARLWRPAPFLERVLPGIRRGRAADLAAGSGREAVFLALHGFEVEAWDHAPEALDRARRLASRHGVSLRTVVADLERDPRLPVAAWDLIVCFRFLHRPLFPAIERALAPGGTLVYETYRVGQERFGRPTHARFLLASGELSSAFPGLTVLSYEEPEPPRGPVTARLLAMRPGSSDSAS